MLGRRERKREQTKQGLLKAAADLFIVKGYDETTIDDIVAAADVAKVTFYYYFKSKEEIVLSIKENSAHEVLGRAEELLTEGANASEILAVLVTDIGHWTEKNWQLLKVFSAQRFSPLMRQESCEAADKASPMVLLIERIIAHGQKNGNFRKEIDSKETAHFLIFAIMNEQFGWIREGRKKATLNSRMDRLLDFMLYGVCRKK
jgi:TetR/AcrR family fatty acid metabolism transcriptional regulator